MTGWSLGLRTGSNGSLLQLAQNGKLHSQNSFVLHKGSKTSLAGSREKFLPSICRFLVRKQFGMLILVAIALLAFVAGVSMVNKDDASTDSELHFKERFENNTYHVSALLTRKVVVCGENNAGLPPPHALAMIQAKDSTAFPDPCRNFAFPPPPPGDRRRIGPRPCPVCYVPVEQAIACMPRVPSVSPGLQHLTYFREQIPTRTESHSGSAFGGYPSLVERNASFDIKESMAVHCGFVKSCRPGNGTGFDIDAADLKEMEQFHDIIVASAIFGNYDVIQQPKNSGKTARDNVPFYMFVDEETEASLKNSSLLDSRNRVGLWRIILVRNVPYSDARRNGKVPKLLLHRLFPNVRYSIWIDGKLQLIMDPYQILESAKVLAGEADISWIMTGVGDLEPIKNATFAISRHYSRFDVFEEAEANKAAGKYDNVSIDHQIDFYKKEGLTAYSEAKLAITSDVPEGCVIIKEHIPITNLFTCLWFNEVDRFTSRDQLSFATARDKLMAKVSWNINMFLDCERRNFVIQEYHRDVLEQRAHMTVVRRHYPPALVHDKSTGRRPPKRGRGERNSNSRRRRKVGAGSRGSSTAF